MHNRTYLLAFLQAHCEHMTMSDMVEELGTSATKLQTICNEHDIKLVTVFRYIKLRCPTCNTFH